MIRLGRGSAAPPKELEGTQSSLALASVLSRLARLDSPKVVDLGAAHGQNVEFLSRYGCRLEILDLYSKLVDQPGSVPYPGPGPRCNRQAAGTESDSLMTAGHGAEAPEPYDLVLAWDLFDYMSLRQISDLYSTLRPHLRPASRLWAMVSYVGKLPTSPRRLVIRDETTLSWTGEASRRRESPRYTEPELRKQMPGMVAGESFLMRQGYREIVFAMEG